MEKSNRGRHRLTSRFTVIDGGAANQETTTPEPFAGSALASPVDLKHTFAPHPIFDTVQHDVEADRPTLRVVADPETGAEPEVVPGSVAELTALAENPLVSNEKFMEARRRRAAEVAGRRGMEGEQPEQPMVHIAWPPDDGSQ